MTSKHILIPYELMDKISRNLYFTEVGFSKWRSDDLLNEVYSLNPEYKTYVDKRQQEENERSRIQWEKEQEEKTKLREKCKAFLERHLRVGYGYGGLIYRTVPLLMNGDLDFNPYHRVSLYYMPVLVSQNQNNLFLNFSINVVDPITNEECPAHIDHLFDEPPENMPEAWPIPFLKALAECVEQIRNLAIDDSVRHYLKVGVDKILLDAFNRGVLNSTLVEWDISPISKRPKGPFYETYFTLTVSETTNQIGGREPIVYTFSSSLHDE